MKTAVTTFLILSVLGVGVFGIFGMNHESDHGMAPGNCIAAIVKGVECNGDTKPLDAAAFHINAFKDFSLATLDAGLSYALLFAFVSLCAIGLIGCSPFLFQHPELAFYKQKLRLENASSIQKQAVAHWLSLHEHSPTLF